MLENTAFIAKSVHQNLQKFYMMLKARKFSPKPLTEEKELESVIQKLLEILQSASIIEGVLEGNDRFLISSINLLIEIARRSLDTGWDHFLLNKLAESSGNAVFSVFETEMQFDQITERIYPEVFLHIFRMGKDVNSNIDLYVDYFIKHLQVSLLYSKIPVYTSEICDNCYGKKHEVSDDHLKDSLKAVCPKCEGKGKIEEIKQIVVLFYLSVSKSDNNSSMNVFMKDFWKHYSSTKLRLLGNAIQKSNYLGNQTFKFFESCNNDAVIEQYKLSSPRLQQSSQTFWSRMNVLREHDRIVHLRIKVKKDERAAIKDSRDKRARKRVNKHNNAINSIYRANMERFAGLIAGIDDVSFVKQSLRIGLGSDRWEKVFNTFHPDLIARLVAIKSSYEKFIDHFYFSKED